MTIYLSIFPKKATIWSILGQIILLHTPFWGLSVVGAFEQYRSFVFPTGTGSSVDVSTHFEFIITSVCVSVSHCSVVPRAGSPGDPVPAPGGDHHRHRDHHRQGEPAPAQHLDTECSIQSRPLLLPLHPQCPTVTHSVKQRGQIKSSSGYCARTVCDKYKLTVSRTLTTRSSLYTSTTTRRGSTTSA